MATKDIILAKAVALFNLQGEAGTSLRQVAAHIGMSDGNLRYHYKTKEELVVATFGLMLRDMQEVIDLYEGEEELVYGQVVERFKAIFRIMYKYKFLFIESTLLLRSYPSFREAYLQLFKARKAYFMNFFEVYRQKGVLSKEFDQAYYNMLFEQIFIISDNWIKYVGMEESPVAQLEQKIAHYVQLCLGVLLPVFKDKRFLNS